jgi:hypothetical protein
MAWWERPKKRRRFVYEPEPPPPRAAQRMGPPPRDVEVRDLEVRDADWVPIGELNSPDPVAQEPDYSRRARGWRPFQEILAERWWRGG